MLRNRRRVPGWRDRVFRVAAGEFGDCEADEAAIFFTASTDLCADIHRCRLWSQRGEPSLWLVEFDGSALQLPPHQSGCLFLEHPYGCNPLLATTKERKAWRVSHA